MAQGLQHPVNNASGRHDMKIKFKDVPVGTSFISNGNICTKLSTRTAVLVQYMRTFYFKSNELVEVA